MFIKWLRALYERKNTVMTVNASLPYYIFFLLLYRRGIALCCLGGPIYAVGGLDDASCYNIVERYDPESDTWSFVQSMIIPRGGVAIAALKVGNISL